MSNYYNAASATVGVTVAKISVTKPSLSATTMYTTGSAVGPTIKNYNSTYMTQSGTTSTSTLGTYRLTWTLKDTSKYQWSDGTTGAYSIDWTCAGGTITFYIQYIESHYQSSGGHDYKVTSTLTFKVPWGNNWQTLCNTPYYETTGATCNIDDLSSAYYYSFRLGIYTRTYSSVSYSYPCIKCLYSGYNSSIRTRGTITTSTSGGVSPSGRGTINLTDYPSNGTTYYCCNPS